MHKLSNEIRRQIKAAVSYPFEDRKTNKSLLVQLYEEVFFIKLCQTCENEQILAYIKLHRLINPKKEMKAPSKKYRFKSKYEDVVVQVPKYRWTITAATLTDKQAEYLLQSQPKLIEEVSKGSEDSAPVDFESMKKAELQNYLDEKGVKFDSSLKKSELVDFVKSL